MLEEAILRDQFSDLLERERQAAAQYERLIAQLTDPKLREQVQSLLRDKQRHIALAERLLEIVE